MIYMCYISLIEVWRILCFLTFFPISLCYCFYGEAKETSIDMKMSFLCIDDYSYLVSK
jgi:hypothetical protein